MKLNSVGALVTGVQTCALPIWGWGRSGVDAAQAVHEKFLAALADGRLARGVDAPDPGAAGLSRAAATDIFLSQLTSRQMDRLSRALQARGEGFYTIGSSGHEGNAAVAARSEEHTSELQSLMRISYAVFCLKKKTNRPSQSSTTRVPLSAAHTT